MVKTLHYVTTFSGGGGARDPTHSLPQARPELQAEVKDTPMAHRPMLVINIGGGAAARSSAAKRIVAHGPNTEPHHKTNRGLSLKVHRNFVTHSHFPIGNLWRPICQIGLFPKCESAPECLCVVSRKIGRASEGVLLLPGSTPNSKNC